MSSVATFFKYDRKRFADAADYLAIALVASLPWSTSATSILVATWLIVLLPTLDWPALRREIATAAGGLPLLLIALAALGMLWADVAWNERTAGLVSHLKLAVIPLLFVQFRRSERGVYAIYALLAACVVLMLASYVTVIGNIQVKQYGTVVKDYLSQSAFFTLCVFLLVDMAFTTWREQRRVLAIGFVLLAAVFLANIVYVTTGRTALLVIPVLIVLFGLRRNWKAALGAVLVCVVLAGVAWLSSPYLRHRLEASMAMRVAVNAEVIEPSSTALRLAFWTASIDIIKQAPLLGHGTGTIRSQFQQYGTAHPGSLVEHASNPHQQVFAVAMQTGIVGVAVMFAMWLAHGLMFRGPGFAAWFGCVIVVQNVIGSMANSHLFDFTQGWTYAVCVGIAGGMIRARDAAAAGGA
jgi:Flp pilus assembly pilin Flp